MCITTSVDTSLVLNKRSTLRYSSVFFHTFMYMANGRLHDSLLKKISTTFFGGLPAKDLQSTNARVTLSRRQDFAHEVDERRDYYLSAEYSTAWRNCCLTALKEFLSAGVNASRNLRRHKHDRAFPNMFHVPLASWRSLRVLSWHQCSQCMSFFIYLYRLR